MANETTITIIGNLTADPDLRVTGKGDSVVGFTVASTPRTYDKNASEWRDGEPLFLRCSAWRDMAESISQSLTKGARVIVTGRLKQRSYEKDGQTRTVVELDVDEIGPSLKYATATVKKMSRTGGSSGQASSGQQAAPDPWSTNAPAAGTKPGFDDEPPF